MRDPLEELYGAPPAWPAELLELRDRAQAEALGWEPSTGAVAAFAERRRAAREQLRRAHR